MIIKGRLLAAAARCSTCTSAGGGGGTQGRQPRPKIPRARQLASPWKKNGGFSLFPFPPFPYRPTRSGGGSTVAAFSSPSSAREFVAFSFLFLCFYRLPGSLSLSLLTMTLSSGQFRSPPLPASKSVRPNSMPSLIAPSSSFFFFLQRGEGRGSERDCQSCFSRGGGGEVGRTNGLGRRAWPDPGDRKYGIRRKSEIRGKSSFFINHASTAEKDN